MFPFYLDKIDMMESTCVRTTDFTLQFFALFSSPDQQIQNFFFAPNCFKILQKEIQKSCPLVRLAQCIENKWWNLQFTLTHDNTLKLVCSSEGHW